MESSPQKEFETELPLGSDTISDTSKSEPNTVNPEGTAISAINPGDALVHLAVQEAHNKKENILQRLAKRLKQRKGNDDAMDEKTKRERRKILGRSLRFGAALTIGRAVTALGGNEASKETGVPGREIIRTKYGNFYPIYEDHRIGIRPEDIPSGVNGIFREYSAPMSYLIDNVSQISALPHDPTNKDIIPSDIRKVLSERGISIIFGDAPLTPDQIQEDSSQQLRFSLEADVVGISGMAIGALLAVKRMKEFFLKEKVRNVRGVQNSGRRALLKLGKSGFKIAAGYGMVNLFKDILPSNSNNSTVERVAERFNGILTDIHPESKIVFFRDIFMAHTILHMAENTIETTSDVPNYAFWVGKAHAGMEDFIQLGLTGCRDLIASYAILFPDFIRGVVTRTGGLDKFCTSLSVQLMSPENQQATGAEVEDVVPVIDEKLKILMKKALPDLT